MVKLPKEMQKKEKSKPTRPQATKKREGQQFASRQTRRRMQRVAECSSKVLKWIKSMRRE